MKTIILCGGKGYRLKEETEFKPKPMILIGGKPMLWHIMKIYAHHGFNKFIIALGYKGEYIKDYFLNQKHFVNDFTLHTKTGRTKINKNEKTGNNDNFKITFVDTGLESLTAERLRRLKNYVKDKTFMVTYGDGVSDVNISEIIKFHKKKKVIGTITGVHLRSRFGLVKTDNNDLIVRFREKPLLNEFINGGFMIFEPGVFNYIKPDDMMETVLARLAACRKLAMYTHDGFWHMMDTYQDMDDLNKMWEDGAKWKVW